MEKGKKVNKQHIEQLMELVNQSPFWSHMGMKLVDIAPGYARMEMEIDKNKHYNPFGSVHGGVNAALIDSATYWAGYYHQPENAGFTTLDVSVTDLAMAKEGKLTVHATAIKEGRSVCLCEAVIKDENDRVVAHGTSKLLVLQGRQTIADALKAMGYDQLPDKFCDE
ncbi:MAG: PaaI family thioesterase [Oscillospiraceae bacterium]|nr:PaaI family thioesterase [Oscillospiraceae bacterium]MBP1570640.1 PaaI family thioesterase [Oscillospiraceae bacterium]MBQ5314332.1 PaaI family thioesterase [Oscillospiraceae bacterium]